MRGHLAAARTWLLAGGVAIGCLLAPALGTGVAQAAGTPRAVVILFDTNISPAKSQMSDELAAAQAYVGALPADVKVGLITFNDTWQTALKPTASRGTLLAALAAVKSAGGTSKGLPDALTGAAAAITKLGSSVTGRLLVLSDAEFLAAPAQLPPFPIDVVSWHYDSDDYQTVVQKLATDSGGKVADPTQAASLAAVFPALSLHSPGPKPTAAPAAPSGQLGGPVLKLLVIVFVVLFVLALITVRSLRPGERRPKLTSQLERYGPMGATPGVAAEEKEGKLASTAVGLMKQVLSSGKSEPKLAQRLDRAGITRAPAEWAVLGVCVSVGLVAMLTLLLGNVFAGVLLGVLGGWLGMRAFVSFKIARRQGAFDEQLPNVLQLVAGSLQTGFSLSQALDAVVREDEQPASGEFARALGEARLGVDIADALDSVANRLDSSDLRWTVMAIRIQRETGGNLAEVLRSTVATMRERSYLRRQVRSLSAEGRMSAYVLLALPILVSAWLFLTDQSYIRPLYTTPLGLVMLIGAIVMVIVGAWWMRKLINIEV